MANGMFRGWRAFQNGTDAIRFFAVVTLDGKCCRINEMSSRRVGLGPDSGQFLWTHRVKAMISAVATFLCFKLEHIHSIIRSCF